MQRTRRWVLSSALLLCATPAAAQTPPAAARTQPAEPHAAEVAAATFDPLRPIRLGLTTLPPLAPIALRVEAPVFFAPQHFEGWLATRAAASRARIARLGSTMPLPRPLAASPSAAPLARRAAAAAALAPLDTTAASVPRHGGAARGQALVEGDSTAVSLLPDALAQYADLSVRIVGRGELGGAWTRHEPCDPSLYYNCRPTLFPALEPDVQLGVLVGGTISERVHVDVDYDQRREFDAANNIRVYFQGREGELLQRLEVGDVTLRLPSSRYLTHGIPAGNFGLLASGQRGPLALHAVYAQQRGAVSTREFRLGGGAAQQGLVQEAQLVLDDAEYVRGQFFFLVHPDSLAGAPHVDALALRAADAPPTMRPRAGGTIRLYRDERLQATSAQQRAQLGHFLADAASDDGSMRHTGLFRRLEPEHDYTVHASGLWIVLRAPLRPDEALAVAYVAESGAEIGDVAAESSPAGATPVLRLLRGPTPAHQPGVATWPYEMRHVYRIDSGGGVDVESVELAISLGEPAAGRTFLDAVGRQLSYLRLFGLDDEAPVDRVDRAQLWHAGRDAFGGVAPGGLPGTYLMLRTLRPFADPPAVRAENLTAAQAKALLGADANAAIYDSPDPVARADAARFRLSFRYRVRVDGVVSTFNLGALGIREGSERLRFGERVLVRGEDYDIDYDIGTVTLNDAVSLFAREPGAEIRAQWEQKSLFDIAPTSIYGLNARYDLGARGELSFVGLYQAERALTTRPQLGSAPGSMLLGGASGRLAFGVAWLDRALDALPFGRGGGGSRAELSGELALSSPDPNRRGDTYLDDFETGDELSLSPRRQDWRLGARPGSHDGAHHVFPFSLDVQSATQLVWQHDVLLDGVPAGSVLPQRDLDRQISVAGAQLPEPALWLTFGGPDSPPTGRAWRSLTTVLAPTGRDMTRSEYLEFYVRADGGRPLALVFDLGTVGEDAFWYDEHGNTTGIRGDGRRWGLGVLDEEASLAAREVWGPDSDARGLWDEACMAEPLVAYPLGDPRANCTRGNGMPDSEDLDGNGVLDAMDGAHFRYVVELDGRSPYLVRDTAETGTRYRLYRIPLRGGVGTAINGANENSWRFIRHLRLTVTGELDGARAETVTLARMRIIGARWTKRDVHGIRRGLLADEPGLGAELTRLRSGPVSRLTDGASYSPPPGVVEQLQDPTQRFGAGGVEFNEKSLRIAYDDLLADERAELYFRYPQQPRSFLEYRQLRLWAVARQGRWGTPDGEQLVVRVGTDARNYYLYRTPLQQATGPRPVTDADWLPEVVIEFGPWLELKARAEQRLVERGPAAFEPDTLWSEDGRYAIVFEDRARAPNLAAVRELVLAVYNAAAGATSGEVWIDDMRLGAALREPGSAGQLAFELRAGELFDVNVAYGARGGAFQQLNQEASYVGSGELSVHAGARLDRLLPEAWGIDAPLSVSYVRATQTPTFLERSDVRADRLDGLRDTGSDATRVSLTLRRATPLANPLLGALVDGAALRIGYTAANASALTTRNEAAGMDVALSYRYEPGRRAVGVVPAFVARALRALAPRPLEESDAFARLLDARLRWTPRALTFGTSWFRHENRAWRFDRILAGAHDSAAAPYEAPRRGLEQDARLAFAPFDALSAEVVVRSHRDLLEPERATTDPHARGALQHARDRMAGIDLGWETNRTMTTSLAFRPRVTPWLRPSYSFSSRYGTDRHASYLELVPLGADTAALLQRRFLGDRSITRAVQLEPLGLYDAVRGRPDADAERQAWSRRLAAALLPFTAQQTRRLGTNFERETSTPSLGWQLGIGAADAFRFVGGDTAVSVRTRADVRLASGVRLPGGAQLDVSYSEATQDGYDRIGGSRRVDERGWPQLRLAWLRVPLPATLQRYVASASVSTGIDHTERISRFDVGAAQERYSDERRVPVQLGLALGGGVAASYSAVRSDGASRDPTGRAEQYALAHSVQLSGPLRLPELLVPRLRHPLRAQLGWTASDQRHCRFRSGQDSECVPYLDVSTSSLNLGLDTRVSELMLGMQMTYTTRHSAVGTANGTNRFQLNIFGQFSFEAGRLPAGGVR